MRRRFKDVRVCCCTPDKGVMYLNAKMLQSIVDVSIHPMRCASTTGRMAQKGLLIGDLCMEARHPLWALKVWRLTLSLIHAKDYDDWCDVWFNTKYVRLGDVIADGWCEVIGRRIDEAERRLGLSDAKGRESWEYRAGDGWYDSLYYEKYDACWDDWRDDYVTMRNEAVERQQRERLWYEALGWQPPQAQDFFCYWGDYDPAGEEDYNFMVDDWDEGVPAIC